MGVHEQLVVIHHRLSHLRYGGWAYRRLVMLLPSET